MKSTVKVKTGVDFAAAVDLYSSQAGSLLYRRAQDEIVLLDEMGFLRTVVQILLFAYGSIEYLISTEGIMNWSSEMK